MTKLTKCIRKLLCAMMPDAALNQDSPRSIRGLLGALAALVHVATVCVPLVPTEEACQCVDSTR